MMSPEKKTQTKKKGIEITQKHKKISYLIIIAVFEIFIYILRATLKIKST